MRPDKVQQKQAPGVVNPNGAPPPDTTAPATVGRPNPKLQQTQVMAGAGGELGGGGDAVAKTVNAAVPQAAKMADARTVGSYAPPPAPVAPAAPPPTFTAPDPNVAHPSDFVSFGDFAGMNQGQMKSIADAAAAKTQGVRNQASEALARAQGQSSASTPVEKTAAYADYLKLQRQAQGEGGANLAPTGNPYEDALRGIYAQGQTARETAADSALASSGAARAGDTNAANQRAQQYQQDEAARLKAIQDNAAADKTAAAAQAQAAAEANDLARRQTQTTAPDNNAAGRIAGGGVTGDLASGGGNGGNWWDNLLAGFGVR